MREEIFGLFFDFEPSPSMRFCLGREGALQREEVAKHPLRMLEMIRIPHLLPIEIEEQDLRIKLYYSYEQKVPLAQLLTSKQLDDYDCLQLIDQLFYPFLEAKNYMLGDHCFLIDHRFVFVDPDHLLVYLTYLPLKSMPEAYDSFEQLYQLIQSIMARMTKEKQKTIETILLPLEKSKDVQTIRSIRTELRHKINSYYKDKLPQPKEQRQLEESVLGSQLSYDHPKQAFHEAPLPSFTEPAFEKQKGMEGLGRERKEADLDLIVDQKQLEPLSSKAKTYLYLSIILLLSIVWKIYFTYPVQGMLYASIAFSFLVLNAAIILQKFWRPTLRKKARNKRKGYKFDKQKQASSATEQDQNVAQVPEGIRTENTAPSAAQYYEQLALHTQILSQDNTTAETAFLNSNVSQSPADETNSEHEQSLSSKDKRAGFALGEAEKSEHENGSLAKKAYLVNNSTKEVISLSAFPFLIGRNPKAVSHVESQLGVSREHFKITWEHNEFFVADLGSRNGTFLNGQRLVEFQAYSLQNADLLQMANLEFTFRIQADALVQADVLLKRG